MGKIDHTSINESLQRQIAAKLIDEVEDALHQIPQVKELAERPYCTECNAFLGTNRDDIPHAVLEHFEAHPDHKDSLTNPNTLLYGEAYYDLEDSITETLVENFIRKGKRR